MANKSAATGALSASIAHELNQPLAAIQLNTQFLRLKLDGENLDIPSLREIASHIEGDNRRIANIVSSLRNIFGKEVLESKLSQINPVIESLMPILLPQVRDRNIQLIFDLKACQPIYLNEPEIKQVILNLINNAIDALVDSPRNDKTITVQTQDMSDGVELIVVDNGPGISESLQSNLFDLMKSSKDTGMGLGLWLCKHIVERHQGKISARNLASGGAQFRVSIPLNLQ
jgi:signal transduction histidine kinase